MRILLSSPSDTQRAYLGKALTESLNSVETTDDLRFAHYLATQETFDAVVICTHGEDAPDTLETELEAWRDHAKNTVLVVALAHATPAERARVLRAGADACFVQPYSVLEIIERLRVLARGAHMTHAAPPAANGVRLDPLTRALADGATRVPLTRREYLLLECLLRAEEMPVARDYLVRYVWPEKDSIDPASLNPMVLRLRRKLENHRISAQVHTVKRYGYRLEMAEMAGMPETSETPEMPATSRI